MEPILGTSMNQIYRILAEKLLSSQAIETVTRSKQKLHELPYCLFTLRSEGINDCFATIRPQFSREYLRKEFDFYCAGSDKLEDALKLSSVWKKCSDDGETITSNYGKLLLHDKNTHGLTQFEHVVEALVNNKDSKKAVMGVYGPEHSYMSNDNPCTMFLHFRIMSDQLFLRVHMRSNDIWFGLPYDVPFFCAVFKAVHKVLSVYYPSLLLGHYQHYACSLHAYEKNFTDLVNMLAQELSEEDAVPCNENVLLWKELCAKVDAVVNSSSEKAYANNLRKAMGVAWFASNLSSCLKKKCGAALMRKNKDLSLTPISTGYNGRVGPACSECVRELLYPPNVFHGDECWSVHAEMRAIVAAKEYNLEDCVIFSTHGPCDACMKLIHYAGIKEVYYAVPYKTNYAKNWPDVKVTQLSLLSSVDEA